jgi:hypothetical protein
MQSPRIPTHPKDGSRNITQELPRGECVGSERSEHGVKGTKREIQVLKQKARWQRAFQGESPRPMRGWPANPFLERSLVEGQN